MATYSIKQMSLISGIKAHTIRIWEKRYNMFSPSRTDTNIRRYSDDDLRLALNTSLLQNMGYKISRIAKMSGEEIKAIVDKGNEYTPPPAVPESLFSAAMNLDKEVFTQKLWEPINQKGMEWTYENLIVPFQKRMGLLWQTGAISPAQEHFSTNIIREILISFASKANSYTRDKNTILFFLPEGEYHEIGLLYFNYIANEAGVSTLYLGQNVPITNVISIAKSQNISTIFTAFSMSIEDEEFLSYLSNLSKQLLDKKLVITGYLVEKLKDEMPENVYKVSNAQQFKKFLSDS